jgi:toxin ParE1/3/4
MGERVDIRPQVYLDLDEIAAWIQRDSPNAAMRFLDSAEVTFQSLAELPGMGGRFGLSNPRLQELRCFPVKGFANYLIFYLPHSEGIDVIRVIHGARDLPTILEQT